MANWNNFMKEQTEILEEQKKFSRILTVATIILAICASFQIITTISIFLQEESSKLMLKVILVLSSGLVGFLIAQLELLFQKRK